MNAIRRLVNALRGRPDAPKAGVLAGRGQEDLLRDYPADGLTPQRLVSIFREADGGSVAAQMALYEQMEEKDAHLFSVANTRRLAVTGLPWEVVSAAELPGWGAGRLRGADRRLADAAAAYCDEVLRNLPGFEESLVHLSLANGRNIAVAELVWEPSASGVRLMEIVPVDFSRITFDDRGELRMLTADAPVDGVAPPPSKFIVHVPHAVCGLPVRGGLMRATAMAYLGKHFAIKDWLIFAEVFGMPVRIARYHPGATAAEKRELLDMLRQLGADATGIFSKAVEIEIKQTRLPGETNLYENLCLYFDREISKAWLGQTLTVDTTRNRASAGAASVHDRVRRDLRDDDLRKEARTIRRDLLETLTRFEFGPDAPTPHFRRIPDQVSSPEQLIAALRLARDIGLSVPSRWAAAALGIPATDTEEKDLAASE
ncbi:MAG: DUF935 family protein [Phycisphaerae bacterium]|nr:DUF935 family protein [Phycisphaerae bacterium]